jgi:phenylpyruvate tautomerase PptA (4-oxalocrotonate tautomerase family)
MPFARIHLLRGKLPSWLQAVSDSVHRALVEAFEVPPTDRFQVIHQLEPHELSVDRHYMGGPRSDDYVLVVLAVGRERTYEVKQAFYRRLAELLAEAPGIRAEDVMVIIQPSTFDDWSFSGGIAASAALAR